MQNLFEINSASGNYKVSVGRGVFEDVSSLYPEAIYIVDAKLESSIPSWITRRISIVADENNKSLEFMPSVIVELRKLNATRESHIVAVGGGIIQDIATFVSSIYMRGISWTYVATTVLSMVDSCVGGKSSINEGIIYMDRVCAEGHPL